jgi:hypothetical protein
MSASLLIIVPGSLSWWSRSPWRSQTLLASGHTAAGAREQRLEGGGGAGVHLQFDLSGASTPCRYLGAELREPENSDWKAAGVLVYTFDRGGELLMLLGRPDYSALPQEKRRDTWNLLGEPQGLGSHWTSLDTATPGRTVPNHLCSTVVIVKGLSKGVQGGTWRSHHSECCLLLLTLLQSFTM